MLLLNWISNNNGKSWFRGVAFTLLVGLTGFYFYGRVLDIKMVLPDFFQKYIVFISSFPKLGLKEYSELPDTWDLSLVVWLTRIFISYGVFQTIAAFRKYGKG